MKIQDATPEFKALYDKHYAKLKATGLIYQPKLSSLAKKYAALDLEVQKLLGREP